MENAEKVLCEYYEAEINKTEAVYIEINDTWISKDKFNDYYFKCDNCGTIESIDDVNHDGHNYEICQNCLENKYHWCDYSSEYFHSDEMIYIEINDTWISKDKFDEYYFYCDKCDAIEKNEESNTVYVDDVNTENWCNDCYESESFYCENCENTYHIDLYGTNEDYCNCVYCSEENSNLKEYSYKPSPIFFGKNSKFIPFIGIELEVESNNNDIKDILEEISENDQVSKKCYFKRDSSLRNGFEIVSHPMTIDEHLILFASDNFLSTLKNKGCRSYETTTCGIHIHIDRRTMTDDHLIRFGVLFNYCKKYFEILAQRKESNYAKFVKKNKYSDYKYNSDRYESVNYQNKNTVEVRIFKGTLAKNTIISHLQLCQLAYNFTMDKKCFNTFHNPKSYFQRFVNFIYKQEIILCDELKNYLVRKSNRMNEIILPENNSQLIENFAS